MNKHHQYNQHGTHALNPSGTNSICIAFTVVAKQPHSPEVFCNDNAVGQHTGIGNSAVAAAAAVFTMSTAYALQRDWPQQGTSVLVWPASCLLRSISVTLGHGRCICSVPRTASGLGRCIR
jgi:hypothetical protein